MLPTKHSLFMGNSFIVEAVEEKLPLQLICDPGVVKETLRVLFEAADFVLVDGNTKPFAVVVVGGNQTTNSSNPEVPVYRVWFGKQGPGVGEEINLCYEGVFSEATPALSLLDELVRRLLIEGIIKIRGGECAPLLLEDACQHVVKSVIAQKRKGGVFVGEHRLAFSSLMEMLAQRLKLQPKGKGRPVRVPLILGEAIPSRSISQVVERMGEFYSTLSKKPVLRKHQPLKRKISLALFLTFFVSGLVFSGGYFWYYLSVGRVLTGIKALAYEPQSVEISSGINQAMSQVESLAKLKSFLTSWLHAGELGDLELSLSLIKSSFEGMSQLRRAKEKLFLAYEVFRGSEEGDSLKLISEAEVALESAYKHFSSVQVGLAQPQVNFPQALGGRAIQEQLINVVPQIRKEILGTKSILEAVNIMLNGKHTYAVLLLDDTQLRGSGGVVASVAVITVDSGKLLTSQVYPVSVVNQMLAGEVQAPEEVRVYLKSADWTLVDTTWETPFEKSAEKLVWFLSKQLSRQIDGVLTLPASRLPLILGVSGGIKMEGGEVVNTSNFQSRREDLLMGMSKDPKTLENWYDKLLSGALEQLWEGDEKELERWGTGLKKSAEASELFVGMINPELQQIFNALAWDGSLKVPECPQEFVAEECRVTGAMVVENNLGGNNSNSAIERSHVHAVRIGEDVLLHNRVLTLVNKTKNPVWPFGAYQALVKYYLSNDAQVQSISINDQVLAPNQFSILRDGDNLVIRVGVEVAPTSTVRVRLLYTEPGLPKENSSLVFLERKQAGAGDDPFSLILTYPEAFTPKSVAPRADVGKSSLSFTSKHDRNQLFAVGF